MGIRPSMMTVFGIDDLKTEKYKIIDPRLRKVWPDTYYEDLFEAEMIDPPLFIKYSPDKPSCYYEILQWDAEFGVPGVIGLITARLPYDNDVVRALAMLDNKFFEAGYSILPTEKDSAIARMSYRKVDVLSQHFYQQGFYSDVPGWIEAASYIFEHLGLDIKPDEMKWMLYWQWS